MLSGRSGRAIWWGGVAGMVLILQTGKKLASNLTYLIIVLNPGPPLFRSYQEWTKHTVVVIDDTDLVIVTFAYDAILKNNHMT